MNAGHFAYLLADNKTQRTKVAGDRLDILAKSAAKQYIENKTPLNSTIAKFAQENDLNSNQIERVCEMANIATHQGLWSKTAQKDSVAFPLADAKAVKIACGCGEPPPAPENIDADYSGPPKEIPGTGPSLESLMGVDPTAGHNGLYEDTPRQRIIVVLQKKAAARQRIADRVLVDGMQLENELVPKAFHLVKQAVIGGVTFRQLYTAAAGVGLSKVAAEMLPAFEKKLIADTHGDVKTRLVKHAISKAPEDLISDDLGNTTIINGAHPVLVSLDTVQRKDGEIRNGLRDLLRIDDEVKILRQQMRELS